MVKLLVAIIPAVLVVAIAILSVQNATPVPIFFLSASTVALPAGVWLAFALGIGMVGTALLLSLFGGGKKMRSDRL
ncbi:MAG: lipopolysaccharide assembly protein LapA domain-containing protein [Phormidesmis sp.]